MGSPLESLHGSFPHWLHFSDPESTFIFHPQSLTWSKVLHSCQSCHLLIHKTGVTQYTATETTLFFTTQIFPIIFIQNFKQKKKKKLLKYQFPSISFSMWRLKSHRRFIHLFTKRTALSGWLETSVYLI